MKKKLGFKEILVVGSTLFGMFFGAGNLIFPVHMGQLSGSNVLLATLGFIITGVTIPILAVAAIGNTHSNGLQDLCNKKVGTKFGYFFTCLLYLTIGPFFAIPRCCTTTFSTGVYPLVGQLNERVTLLVFSAIFFALVLFFSLRPSEIMTWVGKVISPIFILFLAILVIAEFVGSTTSAFDVVPTESYASGAVFSGLLEGYNTMDAIAGLAFGIIVIENIKTLGVKEDGDVAKEAIKSGIVAAVLMGVIYLATAVMGAQSLGITTVSENGGIALSEIASHYLGKAGSIILALTIGFACLKTSIGLVTSCSETFVKMFPKSFSYKTWAIVFTVFSFAVSNIGLTALINYSVPVLMFIYPIAIVLIILCLLDRFFGGKRVIYIATIAGALIVSILDFLKTLPFGIDVSFASKIIPLYDLGIGWIITAAVGFIVGFVIDKVKTSKKKA